MNEIPCTEEKCLKYPVCRSKKEIRCDALRKYIDSEASLISAKKTLKLWDYVYTILPGAIYVYPGYTTSKEEFEQHLMGYINR